MLIYGCLNQRLDAIVEPETKAKYKAEYEKFFKTVIIPGEPTDSSLVKP